MYVRTFPIWMNVLKHWNHMPYDSHLFCKTSLHPQPNCHLMSNDSPFGLCKSSFFFSLPFVCTVKPYEKYIYVLTICTQHRQKQGSFCVILPCYTPFRRHDFVFFFSSSSYVFLLSVYVAMIFYINGGTKRAFKK